MAEAFYDVQAFALGRKQVRVFERNISSSSLARRAGQGHMQFVHALRGSVGALACLENHTRDGLWRPECPAQYCLTSRPTHISQGVECAHPAAAARTLPPRPPAPWQVDMRELACHFSSVPEEELGRFVALLVQQGALAGVPGQRGAYMPARQPARGKAGGQRQVRRAGCVADKYGTPSSIRAGAQRTCARRYLHHQASPLGKPNPHAGSLPCPARRRPRPRPTLAL